MPYDTGRALKASNLWRDTVRGPLAGPEIVTELRAQRPVIAIIQTRASAIRHAVTLVGVTGPSPWLVSVHDPGGAVLHDASLATVTRAYRGVGSWVETHLLERFISLAPPEGALMADRPGARRRDKLGTVRIPMYVAEPADVMQGQTTKNARLAAYEVFPDERGGRIVEVPADGGNGGSLEGPLASAMLESVPRFEHRYGERVRLLHVLGLFVTAVWLPGETEHDSRIVPIHSLSRQVEVGHAYAPDEFDALLREPAAQHALAAERERTGQDRSNDFEG
jgi:hypothetical protein